MNSIALLIPAYEPTEVLLDLLTKIQELDRDSIFEKIFVLDDGSGEKFTHLFKQIEEIKGVEVLKHAMNLGKGAALKTGFNYILGKYPHIKGITTADADGQHSPKDILNLASLGKNQPYSLFLGVRSFDKKVPLRSRIGNIVTRNVLKVVTGLSLSDTQTGLRMMPKSLCLSGLSIPMNGYNFEMEMLVSANDRSDQKIKLVEVPIKTIYEVGNPSSHFNPLLDSMRIYFVFLRYLGSSIFAAFVDNSIFAVVHSYSGDMAWAQFWGRLVSLLISFIILRNLVFKNHQNWYISLLKYISLVATFGIISYVTIDFMNQKFGTNIIIAKLLVEATLFITGFAFVRSFIFLSNFSKQER